MKVFVLRHLFPLRLLCKQLDEVIGKFAVVAVERVVVPMKPVSIGQSGEVIDATEQVVGCDIERVREKTQIIEGWFPSTGFKMRNRRRLKISAFGKLALTESSVLSCTAETVRKHF
ncbi:MAG: hypothetical protein A4E19_00740 [Nitrospira sp. SG-bin1]|nr:MAG: hypothetical protein A4E19_00740 [Nitrospira sp. SG-bin1]